MAFTPPPSYSGDMQDGANVSQQLGLDSITLGQLRAMVTSAPKPKAGKPMSPAISSFTQSFYDFRYDDEDTVMNEIDEFYSYVEMPQVAENLKAWQQGSFPGEWTSLQTTNAQRKAHVEILLEGLEHRDAEIRFTNARRLFYVLQGTFAETTSPEHQLHWIYENCKVVRSANGLNMIVESMKIASQKHDLLCSLSDTDAAHFRITSSERADFLEEFTTEISVYLGMMYHLIEVFKERDDFADELMSMEPPLPVYLFNVVSGLKDKSAKGYPIKKLLLVLWKTLLACCGGIRELTRVKKLARELALLPSVLEEGEPLLHISPVPNLISRSPAIPIKCTPFDLETFHQETTVKYPTFTPPPQGPMRGNCTTDAGPQAKSPLSLPTVKLAQAYSPIPVRHHYHHDDSDPQVTMPNGVNQSFQQQSQVAFRPNPQPATPAPSPPPSPKPKKQQYQTDQNRPFLFPFSRKSKFGTNNDRLVPFAIDEAHKLYNQHMYVSLSLWQMWRTREECMTAESGLQRMPGSEGDIEPPKVASEDPETAENSQPDVALLDSKIVEAEMALAEGSCGVQERKARERKEDLMRLKRVELIYSSVLPVLSGWVLVLLKLLLATVSAGTGGQQVPQSSTSSVFPPGVASPHEQPPAPPPTLDDLDVTRHREITSKAVSAILLLTLKWLKASHVMKFHHLGQLLLDTNCLLLILKMFGLQEVSTSVVSKADSPDHNFFRYCQIHHARVPPRMEEEKPRSAHVVCQTKNLPNGQKQEEEVEMITDFSWRNFFSTINFAKIMQKLSKSRSHRIWMLVQYKSSAVLKRVLRVPHPMLQLHVLKLIKSQVPFCGRKWRQSNMKVITSIYLNCRPDLRDEWLTGNEVDDISDAQRQEQALRHLVKFYNSKRYGAQAANHSQAHRRSVSISHNIEGLPPGLELGNMIRPLGTPNVVEADVFPPPRSQAPDPNIFLPYTTEDLAFEEEYEEYLSDLGWSDEQTSGPLFPATTNSNSAWHRLPEFVSNMTDNISDSESVVSIGDLGDDARLEGRDDRDIPDENMNNWEHMSPKTMAALPKSPAGNRRSSSGGGLRPVLPFGLDDGSAVELDEEDEPELGPMQREESGPFASGGGVDEVEYAYG
ncbi:hypothetical protein F5I97DRAFT_1805804 [Phlebopus sp. FC_14]|nr:hypothetical protein F5I97DRAFT_1805804 [Phlebopus sp. FC_14]